MYNNVKCKKINSDHAKTISTLIIYHSQSSGPVPQVAPQV